MATVTSVQVLRSEVLNKRPDPTRLLSGQPAVNINAAQPGFFFADDTGNSLIKIGPCSVGDTAPNDGATGPAGALGNTLGELWLDTNGDNPFFPGPTLKVWNGAEWIPCFPAKSAYAIPIVADTAPDIATHIDGTLWWNSASGTMYILFNDGSARLWVQVSGTPVA